MAVAAKKTTKSRAFVVGVAAKAKSHGARTIKNMRAAPVKLRKALEPGTVVILLLGIHAGKRVVMLKHLGKSGNILVAGPHSINKVPMRRVNHRYVLATSTKVDVSRLKLDKFNDAYFKDASTKKSEEHAFMSQGRTKVKTLSADKLADNKLVDDSLVKIISTTPMLSDYIKTKFSLRNGDLPHTMRF
eukprot:Lankesteria_metandrocarpae@DN5227_c0_g2_i1.p1